MTYGIIAAAMYGITATSGRINNPILRLNKNILYMYSLENDWVMNTPPNICHIPAFKAYNKAVDNEKNRMDNA